ncbi:hypothetical protein JTB14_026459 [Gonioctena quinquepunctata]|nr:hypothetical protein JTB14_026459 [Gonioctena quinquepunctata]
MRKLGYPGTHPLPIPKVGEESPGANPHYRRRVDLREYDSHNDIKRDKLSEGTRIYHHNNEEEERSQDSYAEQMRGRPPVISKECLMTKPE